MFSIRKLLCLAVMVAVVAGCQQKKETRAESNSPAKDAQSQIAQTPPPPPAPSAAGPKYDYTDARDIKMDGAKAIGKTAKLKILMDYSGAEENHFRAAPCDRDNNVTEGAFFTMYFGKELRTDVRNLKQFECRSAVFKITGRGRLTDFNAKLIELSSY